MDWPRLRPLQRSRADWNLISRTILPIISQDEIFPGAGSQFGLGNTVQSLFFSPKAVVNGFTLGAGPVFYFPTNTNDLLGPDKWGAGRGLGPESRHDVPLSQVTDPSDDRPCDVVETLWLSKTFGTSQFQLFNVNDVSCETKD